MHIDRGELNRLLGLSVLISLCLAGISWVILNVALSHGPYAPGRAALGLDNSGVPEYMWTVGEIPIALIVGLLLFVGAFFARSGLSMLLFPIAAAALITGTGQAWLLLSGWPMFFVLWGVFLVLTIAVYLQVR